MLVLPDSALALNIFLLNGIFFKCLVQETEVSKNKHWSTSVQSVVGGHFGELSLK